MFFHNVDKPEFSYYLLFKEVGEPTLFDLIRLAGSVCKVLSKRVLVFRELVNFSKKWKFRYFLRC